MPRTTNFVALSKEIALSIEARITRLRAFNRFYTNVLGLLRDGLLDTPYSLSESRVLFELGASDGASPSEVAEELRLNLGYVSRVISSLKDQRLVHAARSPDDGRRQVVTLTTDGRRALALLDERSSGQVREFLSRLSDDEQERLTFSIGLIESLLSEKKSHPVVLRAPVSGDYGWVVKRHGELYREQYGWDETFEALVARIVADYIDHLERGRNAAWIAEVNGERVGCIFCMSKNDDVAQLRILLVEPSARGMGVGCRLVEECIRFARRSGHRQMTLWTNDVLLDARKIYERAGFLLVDEKEHHSFGQDLTGQNWLLDLYH